MDEGRGGGKDTEEKSQELRRGMICLHKTCGGRKCSLTHFWCLSMLFLIQGGEEERIKGRRKQKDEGREEVLNKC